MAQAGARQSARNAGFSGPPIPPPRDLETTAMSGETSGSGTTDPAAAEDTPEARTTAQCRATQRDQDAHEYRGVHDVQEENHRGEKRVRRKPFARGRSVCFRCACDRAQGIVPGHHRDTGRRLPAERPQTDCPPAHRDASECQHPQGDSPEAEAEDSDGDGAQRGRSDALRTEELGVKADFAMPDKDPRADLASPRKKLTCSCTAGRSYVG